MRAVYYLVNTKALALTYGRYPDEAGLYGTADAAHNTEHTRQLPSLQLRRPRPSPPAAAATEVEPAPAGPSCAAGAAHARVPS